MFNHLKVAMFFSKPTPAPTPAPAAPHHDMSRDILSRLVRIETRLCALAEALGHVNHFNSRGNLPTKK